MTSAAISLAFSYALAALASVAVALAPLPASAWALPAAAGVAGALWDRAGRHRVPGAVLNLLGLGGFLVSLLPLSRETLAEQSLTALAVLLAVKLLAEKKRRDHLQVLAVALLLIAGAASLQPDLVFAPLLLAGIVGGVLFLLWLPFSEVLARPAPRLLRRIALIGAALVTASAPIALLLFVVLPRAINPFWAGLGGRARTGVSGISDQLALGDVGRIALNSAVAFRAEIEGGAPLPATPYWRGAVLETTDGRRWAVAGGARSSPAVNSGGGGGTRLTYYVEPHGERQLFLLETPLGATIGARLQLLGAGRALRLPLPLARRIRYAGSSSPGDRYAERLSREERALNLSLPPDLPASIRELSLRLAGDAREPRLVAERLLAHFASGYTYSLQVPQASGEPLEDFLFRHRTGYCEYFAASLATLLRAAGIPARVVGGYLGGEFVPAGSYYLVTQASAHAWVEAYVDGEWRRLDPTPAAGPGGATMAAGRARRPLLWLDTLRMRWNSWIVQYDVESQLALARTGAARLRHLREVRFSVPVSRRAALAALGLAALVWLALAAARRGAGDPLTRRVRRFETLAARRGQPRAAWEGPLDHAARLAAAVPGAGPEIMRFAALAASCRYGGRDADRDVLRRLDALLARIRAQRPARRE